ncbi:MAG: transcription elongation factor GreA [Candidatus Magasanikbacteria bacterium CG11_big_fil_rev_8_21_14_0_20_39_34]|uniref:Transcription elongation factor GreA n=1 Tax=Candidatus Magasanikbacteria bacterium CG11_big_fil_rev_8_21_14_0_20_39_34 TaxID=1974653 RepID=A0A2H0N5E4_9BACT|nr:MAG: transcription elongation factor GreA [Candidatus Magasanikbacteria bacterium CG11_big_fil_rev_8_21_14_0_20_39_34]
MTDEQFLTQEKFDELQHELQVLREEKLPNLAKRIDEARQMGDLSENAEYHAAREEMGWANGRVMELEQILLQAKIIHKTSSDKVALGSTIEVLFNGKNMKFTIVGAQEADPAAGKISNESPLGEAFLGKKKGDIVEVQVPVGVITYEVLNIL